jgi:hypothetical protein
MVSRIKIFRSVIAAPVLCLALLGAITAEQRTHIPPANVAPYHARIKSLLEDPKMVPFFMGADNHWAGKEVEIPPAAQNLLRLNAYVSRHYVDNDASDRTRRPRWADLLIVQCSDSSDMDGHWPPNCYPARGEKLEYQNERTITINGMDIPLNEFHFAHTDKGRTIRRCVYNFLIVPNRGIKREMDDVRSAAADYRQRFFGAAQVQVIMDGDLPQMEREAIFADLITPITPVISAIKDTGGHP